MEKPNGMYELKSKLPVPSVPPRFGTEPLNKLDYGAPAVPGSFTQDFNKSTRIVPH